MGEPQGAYISQSFTLSSSGMFTASDDHGNSFSFAVPIAASGLAATTLVGNSTTAVIETKVRAGPVQLADVKLTFSVYDQFCQPAGVRLVISGTENWGPANVGLVRLVFDRAPLSTSPDRAYFGNNSGVALGFDWSDTKSLDPAFDAVSAVLSYSVGPSFNIDPQTVGTSSSSLQYTQIGGPSRHVFYAQGRFWAFYSDGTDYVYSSSPDGVTWSAPTEIRAMQNGIAFWQAGNEIYYGLVTQEQYYVAFRSGTFEANGTVAWDGPEAQLEVTCAIPITVSVATDSNGHLWAAIWEDCSSYESFVYEYTSAWTLEAAFSGMDSPTLVPLTQGKLALLLQSTGTSSTMWISEWGGSSWTSPVSAGGSYQIPYSGALAMGDTVYVAAIDYVGSSFDAQFLNFPYGGSAWSSPATILKGGEYASITSDPSGDLVFATATGSSGGVYYNISQNQGATWTTSSLDLTGETNPSYLTAGYAAAGDLSPALWVDGNSAPFEIRFSAVPVTVQDPTLSGSPWSRPGLSPYESYFSEFSDYVSPGNGLVAVEAGTFDLPGRGLDLAPSLVYTEPSLFQESAPSVAAYATDYNCYGTSCVTSALAASQAPVLLYASVLVGKGQTVSGVSSSPPLAWQRRASVTLPTAGGSYSCSASSGVCDEETWYAVDSAPFSGTVNVTLSSTGKAQVFVAAITGISPSPGMAFDPNGAVPCKGTATSGEPSCSLSTSNPDDLILGVMANNQGKSCYVSSPFAAGKDVGSGSTWGDVCLFDYAASAVQSGLAVTVSGPSCYQAVCAIIGDAVAGGAPYEYDDYPLSNLGIGWSLNLPWMGPDYLHLSDGQAFQYKWAGDQFVYHGVTDFNLTKNSDGGYALYLPDGARYQFNSEEQLVSETDRTGDNTISFSYGSNGYISQATDTVGRAVMFAYDSADQLVSISEGGRTWTLAYSGGQLASLTDPLGRVTAFQYAGTSGADAWLLTTVGWPTGGKVAYAYGSGPVGTEVDTYYATSRNVYYDSTHLSESQSISYSTTNGQVAWSNSTISDGTTIRSYLDDNFQPASDLVKTYSYDGTRVLQQVTEADSDPAGRTNATKVLSPGGTLSAESVSAYDNWGNLIYSKNPVGQQEWFSYANTNSSGSLGSSGCATSFYTQTVPASVHDLMVGSCTYQNGSSSPQQEAFYKYDASGNLVETKVSHDGGWLKTDYTYDVYGNVLTATNPNNVTTYDRYSSAYDSAYLTKTSVLDGTQNVTTYYTYDFATGNLLSETDPNGYTTNYAYDALGRQTSVTYPAVNGVQATAYIYYYDSNNTMKTVDPDGHVTKAYFDGLARETEVQQMNGTSAFSTVYYTYNWADQVSVKTTATGGTYTYSYDWEGRQVKLTNPDGTYEITAYNLTADTKTVTDENGHFTVYAYDWGQRLTSVKEYNSSSTYYLTTYSYDLSGNTLGVTDAKGQTTTYQYDDLNRLVQTDYPTSPATAETKTYDSLGNLLTRTTANGSTITYTYDSMGRLTRVSYPGSGGTVTYTYDADGNRLSVVSPSATDYYAYNARDELTNQTEYVGGAKYQTLYSYDNAGNVASITYPDGYVLSMGYDGVGYLKTVGSFASVSYTPDGQIGRIAYGDGEVATYTYDSRDRPTQILDMYGTTKELDLNYTYDGTGNVLTENTQSYAYDALNRLTNATGPWGRVSYSYDSVGNRVKMVNGSTTTLYTYRPFNRLTSAGGTTYGYDANGNTISKNGTAWTYSYDYENRLMAVAHSGTTVQTNYYDGDGNRVEQTTKGGTAVYSYQGVNILFQKNITSATVTRSFYAGGIQVAQTVNGSVFYLHQDALGSTVLTMTSSVTPSFKAAYTPYGPSHGATGAEAFRYTGKILDEATGLYYEGARYYDPETGRFVTEDSVVGTGDDPQSLNRYVYARDNPMKIVDMNGHEWWNPVADVSTVVSSVVGAASDIANAASNAWNSLPPDEKIGVVVLVSVAVIASTAGIASGAVTGIDAGTIGSIIATGAAVTGLPAIALTADDTSPLDASGLTSLSQGVNSATYSKWSLGQLYGLLGERIDNLRFGDINNGIDAKNAGLAITFQVPGGRVEPDGVEVDQNPPIVNQVKVGFWADRLEALKYVDLIDTGQASPGRFSFYQSPITGKIGTTDPVWSLLGDRGYQDLYTRGQWWRYPW